MTQRTLVLLALASIFGGTSGCAFGGPIACDFRSDGENRCQERRGTQAANPPAYQALCSASDGTYNDTGCPSEGRVGGCQVGSSEVIDWYYDTTETVVRERCAREDQTFVSP